MRWDRYIAIIGRITQRPKVWDQRFTHCHSSHCVFGWAEVDAGLEPATGHGEFEFDEDDSQRCKEHGRQWFGFSHPQAAYVWDPYRTLAELQDLAITQKFPWEKEPEA